MAIEDSAIHDEIGAIFLNGPNPVHSQWRCVIETPLGVIEPFKLFSIDIERLYDKNFSDTILIDLAMPLGVLIHDLYPYKEELIVTLTRYPSGEQDEINDDADIYTRRFRGILLDEKSHSVEATSYMTHNRESSNLTDLKRIELQLMDIALEQIRIREVGGIYRYSVPGDVVRFVLTHTSGDLDLADEDTIIGVDMVEYDNKSPFQHVNIPQGTKLQDVPSYVQDNWGGIYSSGIGCYLQDGVWYVWPEFNTNRFDKEPRNLKIINLPPNRYPGVERTYREADSQVIVISTGQVRQLDKSHHDQLNYGNGVRFAHGDRLWDGFGETEDNRHTVDRSKNNSEYTAIERPNYAFAPVSRRRITNNVFSETSRLAKRQGSIITLSWEQSKPDLLYPGMPSRLVFLDKGEIVEADGVLLRAHHYIHDTKPGMEKGRHLSNTALTLFINKVEFGE